jgi:hypothetical protein
MTLDSFASPKDIMCSQPVPLFGVWWDSSAYLYSITDVDRKVCLLLPDVREDREGYKG